MMESYGLELTSAWLISSMIFRARNGCRWIIGHSTGLQFHIHARRPDLVDRGFHMIRGRGTGIFSAFGNDYGTGTIMPKPNGSQAIWLIEHDFTAVVVGADRDVDEFLNRSRT